MFLSRLHDSPLPQLRKTLSKSSSKAERSSALPNYRTGDKSHRLANVVVFVVQAVLLTKVVTSVVVAVVEVCVFLCSRCGGWYVLCLLWPSLLLRMSRSQGSNEMSIRTLELRTTAIRCD